MIGTLLGLSSGELQSIEASYPTNIKWCCNQMLGKWLEMDTSASWEKLFKVIESNAISAPDRGECYTSSIYVGVLSPCTYCSVLFC